MLARLGLKWEYHDKSGAYNTVLYGGQELFKTDSILNHVAHPIAIHEGRPIALSIGNYAFGTQGRESLHDGLMLFAEIDGKRLDRIELVPIDVQNRRVGYQPRPLVGAALDDPDSWCGIILDGMHVDPVVLKIALRSKPRDRFILVTDAMPSVGIDGDEFMLQGRRITVRDGKCLDDAGTLAGSNLNMAEAVANAAQLLEIDLAQAVRMATEYPAAFLGLDHELGRIECGYRASLVLADSDLNVLETWIDGKPAEIAADAPGARVAATQPA